MKKQTTFYYRFEIKENPVTGMCKIVKCKIDNKTGNMLSYSTIYKNLTKVTADEYKYFLDRGKKPI